VGRSPQMRALFETIEKVAPSDVAVHISGETGTGKELVARAVHSRSKRADGPFVKVNCGSLTETLLESELFGHEKGAFTGAVERKIGRFEAAGDGTVFLDEIGNLDIGLQAKLLRVLQDRAFERLGGTKTLHVKARVISATNSQLPSLVGEGAFRKDLYYRLNGVTIALPPLRRHPQDIPLLFSHFLSEACGQNSKPVPKVSSELVKKLCQYSWPGNVRELKHTAEYLALVGGKDMLRTSDLPPTVLGVSDQPVDGPGPITGPTPMEKKPPRELTKGALVKALAQVKGNRVKTARNLGISRGSIYLLLKQYGLK
jgi:DNA-binding NtrC family response regulator